MRFPLSMMLVACVACERTPPSQKTPDHNTPEKTPDTVVLHDDLLDKDLVEVKLPVNSMPLWAGCSLRSVEGDAVIVCLKHDFALRFDCRDHPPGHDLSMLLGADSYSIHCR